MAATSLPEAAPAPAADRTRGSGKVELVRFLSNPLRYLDALRDGGGDVVPFTLGNLECHLVTKPEYLELAMHNEDWPPISRGRLLGLSKWYALGDAVIPKGHLMALSPWVTHRDPRLWPDPLRFDPERWTDDAERPPELSYFPFSAGPYECLGAALAMKEAVLILATIGQRWKFRPARHGQPKPYAAWATEPRGGLKMTPVRRA